MPIYEYRCEACGHEMDALQKLSDPPLTDCPACGASALKKQLSAAAFRLKGAGWYETDFKKDGRKNLHETGDKSGASSGDISGDKSTGDGKTGTKTETTAKSDSTKSDSAKPSAPAAKPAASGSTGTSNRQAA